MLTEVPETHFCFGCKSNIEGKCMHIKSNYRRMLLIRKKVNNCRYRQIHEVVDVPDAVPKIAPPGTLPLKDDLTKIVEVAEDATKEPEDEEKVAEVPKNPEPEAIKKKDEPLEPEDGGVNIDTSIDSYAGVAHDVHPDDIIKEKKTEEDPNKIVVGIQIDPAKGKEESEPIVLVEEKQPLAHVESEDGSLAAGPTPPIEEELKKEEEEEDRGPTGITLHPKGQPDDGNDGDSKDKGRKFLEDIVDDIEGKSELPANGLLKLETEIQPKLASDTCVEILEILDKIDEKIDEPDPLHIDPKELFKELEKPLPTEGTEIGILSGTNLAGMELMFCFNCREEHPIGYFSPEGNICLNCVQVELRRVLFKIRTRFFDPSAADHELLDEVLKESVKDGKRLSMLETLYIARDLLQSYSPLAQRKSTQIQPTEEVPVMSSPFFITCEEMEPRIQKLTWAQLQTIARKMDVPLNQPIDWIAAQVCARIRRCDKCDQLTLSKA